MPERSKASETPHFRALFISDLHLGAAGARTEAAIAFFNGISCDRLYLVGDIFDGYVGRRANRGHVHEALRPMIACAKEVFYTPGNHDSFMHALDDQTVGALQVAESFVHTTAEGKNFLVLHGDQFDKSCREGWPIAYAGAWAYEFLTRLNRALNRGRQKRGAEPFTFAADAKHAVKKAVKDASTYEAQLLALARTRGCEGVVCGHVHRPEIKAVGAQLYVNSGDWVENNSFVVEYENGRMQLEHLQVPRRP